MDLELKLHSPVGGDSITYSWPVSESDGKEGGDEVVDTIRWACEEHQELKEIVEHRILQDYDVKSFESIKKVCDRYNKAVDSFRQLKDPLWHQKSKELPSMRLVRHIVQQCYNHAVKVPEQLNHYEPFSPEVYGETSFDLVEQFINTIKMGENDYFIDLGSGVGQVVLQVAAATGCELAYGIEKAEWPATYAADMDQQFMKWMSFFGKRHGKYLLEKGDFLTDSTIKDRIESATVIFVNNFAFGPQVDHHLKGLFVNMREGAKIVSSKAFCSLNFRISDRNLSDIGSIMQVQELSPMSGAVSWTGKAFGYFIHTIDRTQLENYFQRKINPRAQNIVEPRRDRRGRLLDSKDKENNKIRRSGDHTYGAAKVLDFDSTSNASTITNTISDDSNTATSLITANTTTTTATEDDNIFLGPTTRRQWTEWVNRPTSGSESLNDNESSTNNTDAEKAVVWKQKVKKRKVMKRLNNGALQKKKNSKFKKKLRVRRSPPVNTQQDQLSQMDQIAHASEHTGSHVKTNKRQAKVSKPPPLTLDSLNLLHTHTILSTMGQGVEDSTKYNDRRMTGMAPGPFKASTQKKTVRSLDMMLPAVDQFVERCRKELMAFLSHMQSTEYIDIVRHQRDIELERHRELKRKAAMYEKEISDLQKNSIGLIRTRLDELGIEANTPSELLGHHEIMRQQHRDLQLQKTELQQEIQCLKSEQLQLVNAQVNAQKQILDPNGIVNNHKKNGVVRRPVETERILQREVMSAYTNNQRLVVQVNQLEQEIQRLELINNQLIAADASAAATLTPIIPVSTSTPAPAVAMPGSKTRSGGSKGTKRKSGGSPVMTESSVAVAFQSKGGNESSSSATTSSSEKLREKLDMKENLEAYSRHVHKLKSEFSAVHNSLDITLLSGESSVKQEVKFQPPDLSFKDLLEKTRMLPCGAVKNETSASSITAVSSAGVAVSCTAPSLSPVKAEVRDVVNGSKRRRTAIGIVLPHTRAVTSSSFSVSLSQNREPVSHSSLSGSTSSSSVMSSTSVASSCQGGKPASPLTDELTVAHELIRIHQIGGPPVVSSVESVASSSSDSVISSVESHRLQSNYSPISRPSSQSSIEGTEVPAAVCAASINRLAQVFPSQGSTGVCQTLMSSGVRIGTLPPSSPCPVTVNVGTMSGGCVSSPHFPGARVMVHTSQQSGPNKAAASSSTGSSTPVLASALGDTKAISSSSSRPQAASCVMPAPSTQVLVQKEPRQQQVVIPSIPVSTRSKGKHITPSPNPVRVEIPFHSTTTDPTTPTTLVVPVPTNNNTAQGPAASGNIGALLNAPVNNKAVVKTQTGSRHQRSRSTTQPRLLQPALPRSQQQVVAISSSTVPITTYPRQVVSVSSTTVPITTYSQQEVAQVLGTSVLSPTTVDGVMQMAMVNGVPQPVRLTSLPQGINGQKDVDDTVDPETKPRADESSDFEALLALASSELDLQKCQKRKAEDEAAPPEPEKQGFATDCANSDIGPRRPKLVKSSSLASDCSSRPSQPKVSPQRTAKTRRSSRRQSSFNKVDEFLGRADADSYHFEKPECSRPSTPSSIQTKVTESKISDHKIEPSKQDTIKIEPSEQDTESHSLSSNWSQKNGVSGIRESLPDLQSGMRNENTDVSDQSRVVSEGDKERVASVTKPGSGNLNKLGDERRTVTVDEYLVKPDSARKADEKSKGESKASKPVHQYASNSSSSRSLRDSSSASAEGREARLDKYQRQNRGSVSTKQKSSPMSSSSVSTNTQQKEELQRKDGSSKYVSSSKAKAAGKNEQRKSPTCTPSLSPKPDHRQQEKNVSRSKDSHHRSPSTSPKPGQHHSKSTGLKHSSSQHTSPVGKKEKHISPSSKPKTNTNKDEHKKSSSQHVSEAQKEKQHSSSLSPKPAHRNDKDRKSSDSSRNVSSVPRKDTSSTHTVSSTSGSKKESTHRPSVGSQKVSSAQKQMSRTSSFSPKPEGRTKDKHGRCSSGQQSSSKGHFHPSSSSPKPEHTRSEKQSKSCPSSRNVSPLPKKESSLTLSTSPKPDQRKGDKDRSVCKDKKLHTPSTSPKPDIRSSEKHSSRTTSPASSKDASRSSSTSPSPKDRNGNKHKSGGQSGSKEASESKHKTTSSKSRDHSPAQMKTTGSSRSPATDKSGGDLKKNVKSQGSTKGHKSSSSSHNSKSEKDRSDDRLSQESKNRNCGTKSSSKNSSPSPSQTGSTKDGQNTPKRCHSPVLDQPQVEKRPTFEHQVSLGFSQEEMDLKNLSSFTKSTSAAAASKEKQQKATVSGQKVDGLEHVNAAQSLTDGEDLHNEKGGQMKEVKCVRTERSSRSCTTSPQPVTVTQSNSAPTSRAPSPFSTKDHVQHTMSRCVVKPHELATVQGKVKQEPTGTVVAKSKEDNMKDIAAPSLQISTEADTGVINEVACDNKMNVLQCLGADVSLREGAPTLKSSESSTVCRESSSPTKTVMVTLKDIAPSLRENGSTIIDSPGKGSGSPIISMSGSDWLQKGQCSTLWRGPRTPPGSPAPSMGSSHGSRRHSRFSSSSSCSSRSSTSSSLSSSTSRGRSTSSVRSTPNRQKPPRKNRTNARRRSLRSYSASSTTSSTSSSSSSSEEEEIEVSNKKEGAEDLPAVKLDPAPPPAVSPLFGPLRGPENLEKRAREDASLPSESSPCSSLSSVTNSTSVSPLFGMLKDPERKCEMLKEEAVVGGLSPGSTLSSTASPSSGEWQRDCHTHSAGFRDELTLSSNMPCEGAVRPTLSQLGAGSGQTEQSSEKGKYKGSGSSSSLSRQSMTHISSKTATSLTLPDLTKPPPTLYCGLTTGYPSLVSSYPSPPVPTPRPGYLPLGSPPPVVSVSPGYISHSPNTPSHSHQPPTAKFSSQLRNHNNNKVGSWAGAGLMTSSLSPSSPSSYSSSVSGSEKPGMRSSHLYPPSTSSLPVQQGVAYPTNHTYWQNKYKYHTSSRSLDNAPARPPRVYASGSNNHTHGWHPYSGGPPHSSSSIRRH